MLANDVAKYYFYNKGYAIYYCEEFKSLPISDRIEAVKKLKLYLNRAHKSWTCKIMFSNTLHQFF